MWQHAIGPISWMYHRLGVGENKKFPIQFLGKGMEKRIGKSDRVFRIHQYTFFHSLPSIWVSQFRYCWFSISSDCRLLFPAFEYKRVLFVPLPFVSSSPLKEGMFSLAFDLFLFDAFIFRSVALHWEEGKEREIPKFLTKLTYNYL